MAKADLTLDYENVGFIPGGEEYPDRWTDAAHDFRQREHAIGRARLNLPYGDDERHALDLFYPAGRPAGLVVFVHGGYWRRFDRSYWSHFAAGATSREWAVAMPSYRLAPDVRIAEITDDIAKAVAFAASLVPGSLVLAGHSAGGHLVSRMNCRDVGLEPGLIGRIERIVPISPVSDLRPLLQTDMNSDLCLDEREAAAESPILHDKRHGISTHVWVGSEERPVFIDQARWLAEGWAEASLAIAPGRHHFDILDDLEDGGSKMVNALLG